MLGSCLDGRVTGCSGVLWLKIRSCYGHLGRAAPMYSVVLWVVLLNGGWGYGYVFATYGRRLWGVCCCAPTRVTCHTSKYEYVFRTGYMFWLGIRICFRHPWVAFVGRIQYAPTRVTCRTLKYGHVIRTGNIFRLGIRICFSNRIHVIHRNTAMLFELGICFG